jgi:FkbM family methyltransferase
MIASTCAKSRTAQPLKVSFGVMMLDEFTQFSFSQFGEDLLIKVLFYYKSDPGFYVDIGAHHPRKYSNTHLLRHRGWRGINVDGDRNLIAVFEQERPGDINLVAFVSDRVEEVTFHRFTESTVNTISDIQAAEYARHWSEASTETVTTRTLKEILDTHLPRGQFIDLLSIDVEGVDLKVLTGNDWARYRPQAVVVEAEGLDLSRPQSDPIVQYMNSVGYRLCGFIHVSAFFVPS